MHITTYLTILGAAAMLGGCAAYQEPPALADATPPAGYNPYFVKTIAPLPVNKPSSLGLFAGRADMTDPTKVRMFLHMVDSTGTYFFGGTMGSFRNMWCRVVDTVNGQATTVKNFTIREVTEREREPLAVAIVMDHSGSMGDARARSVQDAVAAFIKRKATEDAIALVRYDHRASLESPLTTNPDTLAVRLQRDGLTMYGGGTAIHSGAALAIDHLSIAAKGYLRKAVLIFTDGQENSSTISKDSLIRLSWKTGIPVCAVDFGEGINEGYMSDIARSTGGSYSHIYGTAEFQPMFEDVYKRLKNGYVVEFTPDDFGDHRVSVTFCYPKDTLTTTFSFDNTPDIGSVTLLNVAFDYNKASLTAESKRAVDNVVRLMRAYKNMTIELRGHTDNQNRTGDPDYNQKLSQRRAEAVRDAIIKAGVDGSRVLAVGRGDTVPVADNSTEEGRAKNRRTEFIVLTR